MKWTTIKIFFKWNVCFILNWLFWTFRSLFERENHAKSYDGLLISFVRLSTFVIWPYISSHEQNSLRYWKFQGSNLRKKFTSSFFIFFFFFNLGLKFYFLLEKVQHITCNKTAPVSSKWFQNLPRGSNYQFCMYNDPIFNEGLAGFGRGGFHLLRDKIFFSLILTGEIFNKNLKALTDPGIYLKF